jgi:hypothetical protein
MRRMGYQFLTMHQSKHHSYSLRTQQRQIGRRESQGVTFTWILSATNLLACQLYAAVPRCSVHGGTLEVLQTRDAGHCRDGQGA